MHFRSVVLLTLTSLLTLYSFASAANPETTAEAPMSSAAGMLASSASELSPNCEGGLFPAEPSSLDLAESTFFCGPCSVPACQGMHIGDPCGYSPGGWFVTCEQVARCADMGQGTGRYCACPGSV